MKQASRRPPGQGVGRGSGLSLLETVSGSILAGWAVVAGELLVVALARRQQIASVWELQYGTLWLLPTAATASAAAAVVGAGVLVALVHADRQEVRWTLGAAAGVFGAAVAHGVATGRHLSAWGLRFAFCALTGLVAGLAALALARPAGHLLRRAPAGFAGLCLLGVIGLELTNRFLLVRLYPALHAALAFLALVAAPGLLAAVAPPGAAWGGVRSCRRLVLPGCVVSLVLLAAVLAKPAAARLSHFDNFRLLLLEEAPVLGQSVRLAARLAPPVRPAAGCEAGDGACAELPTAEVSTPLDLDGRDILLVTVDALRADHVGAFGYSRPTTPNIDRLARKGAVFERAYCPTPHTSYSITSLMTGKYMRPLLLQGAGEDSETWAGLLRTYGYRTAAFYPPAVFFIDRPRFAGLEGRRLDFEYTKVEFLEGEARVRQVTAYLDALDEGQRTFVWVHLFGPHEPYEAHEEHYFGDRDIDRYDSEIAAADRTVGRLIEVMRARQRDAVVILTADHGEEFGDHGGHYHGTTVYEEQVRVPLVVSAPGAVPPSRLKETVQTIDLLPTVLGALGIPKRPRLRGRDLGALLAGGRAEEDGIAFSETDDWTLLATGPHRLVCARKVGACKLYDLDADPRQERDISGARPEVARSMRRRLQQLGASHGRFEVQGLRAEGRGWPAPILRGLAGDADAAEDVAALLDDADLAVRRKAAELLFGLRRPETAAALRLALGRDDDPEVRRWCALALTRLGQGAPLSYELLASEDRRWRRLAALALAEAGDDRGRATLTEWWLDDATPRDHERTLELVEALARIRAREAVWPLTKALEDVRLRPHVAAALARIGDKAARGPLVAALERERYQSARVALTEALVELGAGVELARPLVRFLGTPDPLPGGLKLAMKSGILEHVGGPGRRDLERLRREARLGTLVHLVVPPGGSGRGVRLIVRARTSGGAAGEIRVGVPVSALPRSTKDEPQKYRTIPKIHPENQVKLEVPPNGEGQEVFTDLPDGLGARPGRTIALVAFSDRHVELEGLAVVPLSDELPPPTPEPPAEDETASSPAPSGHSPAAGR